MKKVKSYVKSLSEGTEIRLNQQIKMEGTSSQFYLAAASWAEKEGFSNAADFLYQHSEEERMHMMKIIRYVNEVGGHALAPSITDIRNDFESLRGVFEMVLEHEVAVTRSINNMVDYCMKEKEFQTFQFLQWYVMEQREEEALARRVLEIFDLIGEEGQGLWLIDQEIGKLAAAKAAESAAEGGEQA